MRRSPVIFIDIDGCLADYVRGLTTALSKYQETPIVTTPEQPTWDLTAEIDALEKYNPEYARDYAFWYGLHELIPQSVARQIDLLTKAAIVYFVTSRPPLVAVHAATVDWLKGIGITNPMVVMTREKETFAELVYATHILEDCVSQALAIQARCPTAMVRLLARPYNADLPYTIQYVHSVGGFLIEVVRSIQTPDKRGHTITISPYGGNA